MEKLKAFDLNKKTLSFILFKAYYSLTDKQRRLVVENSVKDGLYIEDFRRNYVSRSMVETIQTKMQEIIDSDLPIVKKTVSVEEAKEIFSERKDVLKNIEFLKFEEVDIYCCEEYCDYIVGDLLDSTGKVGEFKLSDYSPGFILRMASWETGEFNSNFDISKRLFNAHQSYKRWLLLTKMYNLGYLNQAVDNGSIKTQILMDETRVEQEITKIASAIQCDKLVKLVLIAGPSSSGKTTFASKLRLHLSVFGLKPVVISLDDYFLPRTLTPRKPNGDFDFECLQSIDLQFLNKDLNKILRGEEVELPKYDFKSGTREKSGHTIKLGSKHILIIEGIHALNRELTYSIPFSQKKSIYISPLFQLNLDRHNRITTTEIRQLRRIVRDKYYRGYSAEDTLGRWESIREGEDKNIFPFQEEADFIFNSALTYELAALKSHAIRPLLEVEKESANYPKACKLLAILEHVKEIDDTFIPPTSVLREFIGGSIFR